MRKTARPVVWEGWRAQSRHLDPIGKLALRWNCVHLANANKFRHICPLNALQGLRTPALVTPLQLLEKDDENET